ncbi:MAG: hypothetical protein NTX93_05575 [Bacteroidia bacterium]|nr:hypothetical protein [Bacteroidia bacterium]
MIVEKPHHLPPSGYSSSEEEEKVIILCIKTFPSFLKEGWPRLGGDGVVKNTFETTPFTRLKSVSQLKHSSL